MVNSFIGLLVLWFIHLVRFAHSLGGYPRMDPIQPHTVIRFLIKFRGNLCGAEIDADDKQSRHHELTSGRVL